MSAPVRPIVLLGLMGSGKTTIGTRLAARLGAPFVDGDEQLVAATGSSARTFQTEHGRSALHVAELGVLEAALSSGDPRVVAAAASVVDTARGRDLVRTAHSVWLDVPADERAVRTADEDAAGSGHRPPALDPGEERVRRAHLAATADLVCPAARPVVMLVEELERWARVVWLDGGISPAPGPG